MKESIVISNISCAILSAKWGMELGMSQLSQLLVGLAGLIFGPLTLLILYLYLIRQYRKEGKPGGKML